MNRRQFIKRGLIGGALLGAAGVGLGSWPTHRAYEPTEKLVFLGDKAFQILCAFASRVVPPSRDPRIIAHRVDQSLVDIAPEARKDIESLLSLFDNALAGTLLDAQARPFTALDPDAQDRVLESWRDSRITLRRGGYQALRRLSVAMHYLDGEGTRPTGYTGPRRIPGLSYDDTMAGVKS